MNSTSESTAHRTTAYMSSWKISKEGDLPLCIFASYLRGRFYAKPFHVINFVCQHKDFGWHFLNDEIFLPYNGLKLFIWCITFYNCTCWILCWLSNAFSLQNSIQFILFEETRHVFVKHGCPRRQQSPNTAKISRSYILTPRPGTWAVSEVWEILRWTYSPSLVTVSSPKL